MSEELLGTPDTGVPQVAHVVLILLENEEYSSVLGAKEAPYLNALVDRIRHDGKVDIITHSAGAIVALTYVKLGGGTGKVDHLILIAPTAGGVVDAFRVVVHPERFLRRTFTPEMVVTWPSVAELLPEDSQVRLKRAVHAWRTHRQPLIVTHDLVDDAKDPVLTHLRHRGMFNGVDSHTEVPRKSLVEALKEESELTSTQGMRAIGPNVVTVEF